MKHEKMFEWTGGLPPDGTYCGFVNIKIEPDGVVFTVRSEGSGDPSTYKIPHAPALVLIGRLSDALLS